MNVVFQVLLCPQPAVLPASLGPKIVRCRRVPSRHMDSVSHMADGHLVLGPAWKKRLKQVATNLPVQATHAIYRTDPMNS